MKSARPSNALGAPAATTSGQATSAAANIASVPPTHREQLPHLERVDRVLASIVVSSWHFLHPIVSLVGAKNCVQNHQQGQNNPSPKQEDKKPEKAARIAQ